VASRAPHDPIQFDEADFQAAPGTPVYTRPMAEERENFRVLIDAVAFPFKPYLTDQFASVASLPAFPTRCSAGASTVCKEKAWFEDCVPSGTLLAFVDEPVDAASPDRMRRRRYSV
jgi:hypothetical protein